MANAKVLNIMLVKIKETLTMYDPYNPPAIMDDSESVITIATTSRSSFLSPVAHIVHTLREREEVANDDDRLYDIIAIAALSCSCEKIGKAFMKFCVDPSIALPQDLQLYFEQFCHEQYSGSRDGGSPSRFRAVGNKYWPNEATERQELREGIRQVVRGMKDLPRSGFTYREFFESMSRFAENHIRGVGRFRVGVLLQLLVLSGLAGEHPRILAQGQYLEIVPGTRPFKVCRQFGVEPRALLHELARTMKVSHAVAEASLCEAFRKGGPKKEILFRHQRMYEIGDDRILVGEYVGGPP